MTHASFLHEIETFLEMFHARFMHVSGKSHARFLQDTVEVMHVSGKILSRNLISHARFL